MAEHLYTDHPALYDAIQADWDYDRDVAFVRAALDRHGVEGRRLLEVGCGTGEHTRRFVDAGYEVTAVDPFEGMLETARGKRTADGRLLQDAVTFRRTGLPALQVDGAFDATVAIRGVINHLPPADLGPAIQAVADALAPGGLLVFDNSPLPDDGNEPGYHTGTHRGEPFVRVARMAGRPDGRLDWHSVVFAADRTVLTNTRTMTPFEDATIESALTAAGLAVERHDGYGPEDPRTVFVAST